MGVRGGPGAGVGGAGGPGSGGLGGGGPEVGGRGVVPGARSRAVRGARTGRAGAPEAGARGRTGGLGSRARSIREGRGPGSRRPGERDAADGESSRGSHGRVAGVVREGSRDPHGTGSREGDAGDVTLPGGFLGTRGSALDFLAPMGAQKSRARAGVPFPGAEAHEGVTSPASSSRIVSAPGHHPVRGVTSVLIPPVPFPHPSRGSSCPGRLMAVTACQDRHEAPGTHLGRPHPAAPPVRSQ